MKIRIALCFLLSTWSAAAVPSIGSVTGTVGDDSVVTITGNDFGQNALEQEWLGGATGFIDSLDDGARFDQQNRPGWSLLTPSTQTFPHVSTELAWSRGKSVVFDVRGTTEYKQSLFYDTGSAGYAELYTNALIHLDHDDLLPGSYLQWKMMRWTHTETVVDGDGGYMSNRLGAGASVFTTFPPSGQEAFWFEAQFQAQNLPGKGAWHRYECWVRPGSSYFRVRVTNPLTGDVVADNETDISYDTATPHRYWVLQNYFGNATDGGFAQADNGNAVAFWDDIYASKSQARVEICDAATYTACTNRELQPASAWSDGSIDVRLNQGALTTLSQAFLYVTDANGDVNPQGFELTGGTTPGTGGAASGGTGGGSAGSGGGVSTGGSTASGGASGNGGGNAGGTSGGGSDDSGGCSLTGRRDGSTFTWLIGALGLLVFVGARRVTRAAQTSK